MERIAYDTLHRELHPKGQTILQSEVSHMAHSLCKVPYDKGKKMKNETEIQETTMKSLRNAMMNTIFDVRNKTTPANDAIAIAKIGGVVIESYKTEIEAVRTADGLKDRNIGYAKIMPLIVESGEQDAV